MDFCGTNDRFLFGKRVGGNRASRWDTVGFYAQNDRFYPRDCPASRLAHELDSGAILLGATDLGLAEPRKLSLLGVWVFPREYSAG